MSADDHLYVIGETSSGIVKIGRSVDPESRLRTFQTGYPRKLSLLHVEPEAGHLEPRLHARFASLRTHGEWFDFGTASPVATVLNTLDSLRTRDDLAREYEQKFAAAHKEAETWRERALAAEERLEITERFLEETRQAMLGEHIARITDELTRAA